MYIFCVECREIQAVSNDNNLLPAETIMYSSFNPRPVSLMNEWCANETETSPYVILPFTQLLYLLYARVRQLESHGGCNVSFMYANSSGHRVTYMTVDRVSVRHTYIAAHLHA